MEKPTISVIAAIGARNRVLGKDNQLLWRIPDDLKRFKALTSGHPVIMGRKTWESLPEKFKPLPERTNLVVTGQENYGAPGAEVCSSFQVALAKASGTHGASEIFVIGGGELYKEALPFADRLYMTLIDEEKEGDVFFPEYEQVFMKEVFKEKREFNGLTYQWVTLERV